VVWQTIGRRGPGRDLAPAALQTGRDHVVRRTGAVQQRPHLKRVLDERSTVTAATLASVLSLRVLERGSSLWKMPYHIGQAPVTTLKAHSDRPICKESSSRESTGAEGVSHARLGDASASRKRVPLLQRLAGSRRCSGAPSKRRRPRARRMAPVAGLMRTAPRLSSGAGGRGDVPRQIVPA
jgi:hypothetical protein